MDFAELGIKIDSKQIDIAIEQLKKIQPAAAGASAAAAKLSKAVEGLSVSAARNSLREAESVLATAKATRVKLVATGKATKEDINAAKAIEAKARAEVADAAAILKSVNAMKTKMDIQRKATLATKAATEAMKKQDISLIGAASGLLGGRPANDLMPNRFNTANIAAQFQDIGVTAAMGMSPFTIALQQGTQLSAILNTMESPLKGIAVAFRSILNPVSLLSIGIVGLIAAGVQMVDWTSTAESGLRMLAKGIEAGTDAFVAFLPLIGFTAVAFTALNAGVVTTGIINMTKAVWGAVAAFKGLILANPFALMVIGLTAALTGFYTFRDEITKILGVDILDAVKKLMNRFIGYFVGLGAFLTSFMYDVGMNIGIKLNQGLVASGIHKKMSELGMFMADAFGAWLDPEQNRKVKEQLAGLGKAIPKESMIKSMDEIMRDATSSFGYYLKDVDYVGFVGEGIKTAARAGIDELTKLADGLKSSITSETSGGSDTSKASKAAKGSFEKDPYAEVIRGAQKRIASLREERAALYLNERETLKLKYANELLNDAMQKGIKNPDQLAKLRAAGEEMGEYAYQTLRTKEAMDLLTDTGKNFFNDLKNGLREGKTLWESFGDAAINALNRIVDKFFEASLNMVFDNISGTSGGSNIISSITDFLFNAKGNAFSQSGVTPFAKGGAFTNSVVSNPTLFQFANGGSFGVMGEAGPEAVMPLKRGSDGSLGVQVHGGSAGGAVTVNVINNSGASARTEQRQTTNGTEIDVIIDEMVASKIASQGTASNRALQDANSRSLIRRR